MSVIHLPGAEVALETLKLLSQWPGDVDAVTRYQTKSWDDERGGYVDSEPHFATYIDCSDTFFWGCGDSEDVTDETIGILASVIDELLPVYHKIAAESKENYTLKSAAQADGYNAWREANPSTDANGWGRSEEFKKIDQQFYSASPYHVDIALTDLFAARVRKLRPQGACYTRYPKRLWHLFDEAGPVRETGIGNPCVPGSYNPDRVVE